MGLPLLLLTPANTVKALKERCGCLLVQYTVKLEEKHSEGANLGQAW